MSPDLPSPANDCAAANTMADLLEQGRTLHLLSAALCVGAVAALLLMPGGRPAIGPAAILLCGVAETWLALRVGFDAKCFRRIADAADDPGFVRFDAALLRLGLLPPSKIGRPLDLRFAGARRLLKLQATLLIFQTAIVLLTSVQS